MKNFLLPIRVATPLLALGLLTIPRVGLEAAGFTLKQDDHGIEVRHDGQLWTRYVLGEGNKPFLWPLLGPGGLEVTRAYPMENREGEQHDHPHHRSLWFGHQGVNGYDSWHEPLTMEERKLKGDKLKDALAGLAATVHKEFVKVEGSAHSAVIVSRNAYVAPDGKVQMEDERTFRFSLSPEGHRVIDVEILLKATQGKVTLGDKKDSGFNLRVATSISVDGKQGGHILNSRGDTDKDTWGKRAEWCDFYGPVKGQTMGIAMLNHPSSFRYPTPWHARTYGLFTANPFGTQSLDKSAPDGTIELAKGDSIALRHRVILHKGTPEEAEVARHFEAYRNLRY